MSVLSLDSVQQQENKPRLFFAVEHEVQMDHNTLTELLYLTGKQSYRGNGISGSRSCCASPEAAATVAALLLLSAVYVYLLDAYPFN